MVSRGARRERTTKTNPSRWSCSAAASASFEERGTVRDHVVEDPVGRAEEGREPRARTSDGLRSRPPPRPPRAPRSPPAGSDAARGSRTVPSRYRRSPTAGGSRPSSSSRVGRRRSSSRSRTRRAAVASSARARPSATVVLPSPAPGADDPIRRSRLSRPRATRRAPRRRHCSPGAERSSRSVRATGPGSKAGAALLLERGQHLEDRDLGVVRRRRRRLARPLRCSGSRLRPARQPVVEAHALELERVAPGGLAHGLGDLVRLGLQGRGRERAAPAGHRPHRASREPARVLRVHHDTRANGVTWKARSASSSTRARLAGQAQLPRRLVRAGFRLGELRHRRHGPRQDAGLDAAALVRPHHAPRRVVENEVVEPPQRVVVLQVQLAADGVAVLLARQRVRERGLDLPQRHALLGDDRGHRELRLGDGLRQDDERAAARLDPGEAAEAEAGRPPGRARSGEPRRSGVGRRRDAHGPERAARPRASVGRAATAADPRRRATMRTRGDADADGGRRRARRRADRSAGACGVGEPPGAGAATWCSSCAPPRPPAASATCSRPSSPRAERAVAGRSTSERTLSIRSRSGKGFRRKASAPAASTARMRASERTAETAMNGTRSSPGTARSGAQQVLAVHVGHQDVAHHAVGPDLGDPAQGGRPGREGVGLELGRPEGALEQDSDLRVVVDHDHSPGGVHDGARGHGVPGRQSLRPRFGVSTSASARVSCAGCSSSPGRGRRPRTRPSGSEILREVLAAELGSYRVVFKQGRPGLALRPRVARGRAQRATTALIANTPESVAYNIYVNLAGSGKPIDPTWRPGGQARAGSSSRDGRPSRLAGGTRTTPGR